MTVIEISHRFVHFAKASGSDVEITVSRRERTLCTRSLENHFSGLLVLSCTVLGKSTSLSLHFPICKIRARTQRLETQMPTGSCSELCVGRQQWKLWGSGEHAPSEQEEAQNLKTNFWDFPHCPVVKILQSRCRGLGFNPG